LNHSNQENIETPWLPTAILRGICSKEIYDDIHGDLQELYIDRINTKGKKLAQFHFAKDVFFTLRNFDLRRKKKQYLTNNTLPMFKNYWKITVRNITKNKAYSALNIIGLALGMSACFFILQYVSYEKSYDKFHTNYDRLYRIQYNNYKNNELLIECAAAVPRVGPFMKEKLPEIETFARAYPQSSVVSYKNINYREKAIQITDPDFLKIFDFPLLKGDAKTALSNAGSVVISETAAKKYFGNEDPMGKVLKFDGQLPHAITGIAKDVPGNSHIKFNFLISYQTLNNETDNNSETSWGWYDFNTYVLFKEGANKEALQAKFNLALKEERSEGWKKNNYQEEFLFQPIADIHLYSNLLQESEPEEQGDGKGVFFLTIIAFFILIIAWINYINLSTARSIERAKEVGVRKVMGAQKIQLINQFIFESFTVNFFALVLSLIIVTFGLPYFNLISGITLNYDFLTDFEFWTVATSVFMIGALFSGLYPAFILSSFNPSAVLKGKMSSNSIGGMLRKSLVVFQFATSIALISGTILVYNQLDYMNKLDLGFDMTETLVIKGPGVLEVDSLFRETFNTFKNRVLTMSEVNMIAASSNVPGDEVFWTSGIRREGTDRSFNKVIYTIGVDYDYFPSYKIDFVVGRNFQESFGLDTEGVILNQEAVKYLGYKSIEESVNKKVIFQGETRVIIGVVENYNQMSAKNKVSPLIFRLMPNSRSFFTVKLNNDNYQEAFSKIESNFQDYFPGNPFDYFFLDDFFNRQYQKDQKFSRVFTLFASLAILVACLGLFGLSSFSALQRTKEIGIRKSLGASINNIVFLLSKEYMTLILISNAIAWPVTFLIMDNWLNGFANRIEIHIGIFILSALTVVLIALITVGYKTIQTAKSNPINALRYE
jgi:putative ABC transport system permease protein